jgi:hypothetical protein
VERDDDNVPGVDVEAPVAGTEVEGVKKSSRPKLTPALVVPKLEYLTGPSFRALCTVDDPTEWVTRLMKLYEGWANLVFPQLPFDVFLKVSWEMLLLYWMLK